MYRVVSSFCRIDLPLAQALPLLHDEHSATIEIFCEAPHLSEQGDWRADICLLKDYARTHGVSYALHAPCFDLNPASANAGVRAEVERQYRWAIDCAHELEATHVVVHSGHCSDPRLSASTARGYTRTLLERLISRVERAGVMLALENTGYGAGAIITTPDDLLELAADLPPTHLGLTLDIGHAALQRLDPATTVAHWTPRLCNVHLHDNHGLDDDHLVPGRGVIPFDTWLELLRQHDYQGALTLEAFLGDEEERPIGDSWPERSA